MLIVPLYAAMLKPERAAPYRTSPAAVSSNRLTLQSLGWYPFLLLLLSYITQDMPF